MEGLVRLFKKCWNAAEIGLGHFWKCGMDRHTMRFRMKTKIFLAWSAVSMGINITPDEEQSARIQSVSDGISLQARGVKIVFYDTTDKLKQINRLV